MADRTRRMLFAQSAAKRSQDTTNVGVGGIQFTVWLDEQNEKLRQSAQARPTPTAAKPLAASEDSHSMAAMSSSSVSMGSGKRKRPVEAINGVQRRLATDSASLALPMSNGVAHQATPPRSRKMPTVASPDMDKSRRSPRHHSRPLPTAAAHHASSKQASGAIKVAKEDASKKRKTASSAFGQESSQVSRRDGANVTSNAGISRRPPFRIKPLAAAREVQPSKESLSRLPPPPLPLQISMGRRRGLDDSVVVPRLAPEQVWDPDPVSDADDDSMQSKSQQSMIDELPVDELSVIPEESESSIDSLLVSAIATTPTRSTPVLSASALKRRRRITMTPRDILATVPIAVMSTAASNEDDSGASFNASSVIAPSATSTRRRSIRLLQQHLDDAVTTATHATAMLKTPKAARSSTAANDTTVPMTGNQVAKLTTDLFVAGDAIKDLVQSQKESAAEIHRLKDENRELKRMNADLCRSSNRTAGVMSVEKVQGKQHRGNPVRILELEAQVAQLKQDKFIESIKAEARMDAILKLSEEREIGWRDLLREQAQVQQDLERELEAALKESEMWRQRCQAMEDEFRHGPNLSAPATLPSVAKDLAVKNGINKPNPNPRVGVVKRVHK